VQLSLPADDGGLPLTYLKLYIDDGSEADNPTFVTEVANYDDESFELTFEIAQAPNSLVLGRIYQLVTVAANNAGSSAQSTILQAALVAPPDQPATPTVDYDLSSENSLFIRFQTSLSLQSKSPGGDITGYQLLMATPESGDVFDVVFGTVKQSTQVTEYLVSALMTGEEYRFKVLAFNFNGPSEASDIAYIRVCGFPSGLQRPYKVDTDTSTPSITVGW
jgi:hypothetical protein